MEFTKIIRFLMGGAGVLITVYLLYLAWRVYAYFYIDKEEKPAAKPPPPIVPKETYRQPRFVYDSGTHEFFVSNE